MKLINMWDAWLRMLPVGEKSMVMLKSLNPPIPLAGIVQAYS